MSDSTPQPGPDEGEGEGEGAASNPDAMLAGCGKGCLGIVLLFVVLVTMGMCSGSDDGPRKGGATLAEIVCERSVKSQLKDPDSAKFSNVTTRSTGPDKYETKGTVRARNSFGGMAVSTYTCLSDESSGTMTSKSRIEE